MTHPQRFIWSSCRHLGTVAPPAQVPGRGQSRRKSAKANPCIRTTPWPVGRRETAAPRLAKAAPLLGRDEPDSPDQLGACDALEVRRNANAVDDGPTAAESETSGGSGAHK